MKISYFITLFPYDESIGNGNMSTHHQSGGAQNVAQNLALNMAKRGHEVSVFTTSAGSNDEIEEYEGLTVYRYGTNFRIDKGYFSVNLFWKSLRDRKADIIHAHVSVPPGDLAALVKAVKTNTPLVVTYHGDSEVGYGRMVRRAATRLYNGIILPRVLSRAKMIICPSEYYLDQSNFLGRYRDKVVAVPNGVNLEEFDVMQTKEECRRTLGLAIQNPLILFVGELIQYKGPDVLIKAMEHVTNKVPDARLVLLGDGAMRGELERLVQSLGLEHRVRFAGFISGEAKALYYKAADLLTLPSTMGPESFGVVLLEASAVGLPLVVSDLPSFKTVVEDGHNGIATTRNDDQSLASAIIRILEDDGLRELMGKNARTRAEDFSWENIARETEKVYETVLG